MESDTSQSAWLDQIKPFRRCRSPVVFEIRHIESGRRYVGSLTRNIAKRIRQHRYWLQRGEHHCRALQDDWHRFGADAFLFRLVERVPPGEDVYARQQFWLGIASWQHLSYNARRTVHRRFNRTSSSPFSIAVSKWAGAATADSLTMRRTFHPERRTGPRILDRAIERLRCLEQHERERSDSAATTH